MPKFIVNTPKQTQEIVETGQGGSYYNKDAIVWCWDRDGEPPIHVDLGFMVRVQRTEPLKDRNGKQVYKTILDGDHKTEVTKVKAYQIVTYLRNLRTGKIRASKRPAINLLDKLEE